MRRPGVETVRRETLRRGDHVTGGELRDAAIATQIRERSAERIGSHRATDAQLADRDGDSGVSNRRNDALDRIVRRDGGWRSRLGDDSQLDVVAIATQFDVHRFGRCRSPVLDGERESFPGALQIQIAIAPCMQLARSA